MSDKVRMTEQIGQRCQTLYAAVLEDGRIIARTVILYVYLGGT
jgi:hypothetical protein